MTTRIATSIIAITLACTLACTPACAQKPPAVRPIGPIERVTTDSLASAAAALAMAGGRVLVNDITGRRLVMFDSTLAHAVVVADTTSATANAYGGRPGTLIRYHGDSALFVDQTSLSMLVIGASGSIARVMAVPRPNEVQSLTLSPAGHPSFDARGRLVYFDVLGHLPGILMLGKGMPMSTVLPRPTGPVTLEQLSERVDSAFLVSVDLETRTVDTVGSMRIPRFNRVLKSDAQGLLTEIETTPDPLPLVDAWTAMPDGSIAIVRARDYHVDWRDPSGRWTSSPKMPFTWERVDDARKEALIDSTVKTWQAQYLRNTLARAQVAARSAGGGGAGGGGSGGRGGGGGGGSAPQGGARPSEPAPLVAARAALSDVPDYMPPFTWGAGGPVYPDADGNLWIRTTTMVNGQPVYDIVNRKGELFDRVQLPPFRTIAGFAPGKVFMAVKDSTGAVHLERARVK